MCGFIGNFGCNKNHLKDSITRIKHRGPDHTSINRNNNWNVEFCRLSINDLSSDGNQPFKVGNITAFVNGEIYNSNDLRKKYFENTVFISKSDSEIVPHLYKKFGINFINYLDGMFSIVIIDDEKNKLYLVKDSIGKKPLYYNKNINCECILFSSESRLNDNNTKIDRQNLKTLLFFHFKFFDQSVYENINSIPPGSYLVYENQNIRIEKWYKPKITKVIKNDIEKTFLYLFDKSIKKRLMADVKLGVFLSGGIDSNLIARSLFKNTSEKITTFSAIIGEKNISEGVDTDTLESIKSNFKGLNCENIFIDIDYDYLNKNIVRIISEADHPIIDSSYIIAYACAEKAKQHDSKVIFTGIGADESYGGYNWQARYKNNYFFNNRIINEISKFNKYFLNYKNKYLNYIFFPYFLHTSSLGLQYWKSPDLNFLKSSKKSTIKSIKKYLELNEEVLSKDFKNFLNYINIYGIINHQVTTFDLACMQNSIENRSPFLDKELFEFGLSIPSKYKKNNKQLLRTIAHSICPPEVLKKHKSGPTINYNICFGNKNFNERTKIFVLKNIDVIENYISTNLAKKIKNSYYLLNKENHLPLISIVKIIIWIKYNIQKSINKNCSLEELVDI